MSFSSSFIHEPFPAHRPGSAMQRPPRDTSNSQGILAGSGSHAVATKSGVRSIPGSLRI